jgi:hypothetical protein
MRTVSFFVCIFITALLVALYTSRHNHLTELRIQARTLEKQVKMEEATKKQLELTLAQFFSPIRLEEIARKAQYAYLRPPIEKDIVTIEE